MVTTSPALYTDMSRTGTLVAPGSSNDGTNIETSVIAIEMNPDLLMKYYGDNENAGTCCRKIFDFYK